MKALRFIFAAALAVAVSHSAIAADWVYDSAAGQISDGVWTFKATVAKNSMNLTVGVPVDDTEPSQCPSEITPLDFSKPVVDSSDPGTQYTIVKLDTAFHPNKGDKRVSIDFVGEFTLPGEGFQAVGNEAFADCSNLSGDLVFPTTLTGTALGTAAFRGTKVTSVDFRAATCSIGGNFDRGAFQNCKQLRWVRFAAGGQFALSGNYPFTGCTALGDADFSGVTSITVGDRKYAALNGCTALTNLTLNSDIVLSNTGESSGKGTQGEALFNGNTGLRTIRFTGLPPTGLQTWIESDGGYLGMFANTQDIATIVPAEFRNLKNDNDKSWEDYAVDGKLNIADSTWKAECVKSGVSLDNRKLLLDRVPEDEAPTIADPVVSDVWTNSIVLVINGGGLNGGTISVSLTNSLGVVFGPLSVEDFGDSCQIDGLAPGEDYAVIVIAGNDNGVSTNDAVTVRTLGVGALAARALYTSEDKTLTFYYDTVDRSILGTQYEVGDGSGATWAEELKSVLKYVVFVPEFRDFRPTSCANWFNQCSVLASFDGFEYLDTSEVTSMSYMFRGVNAIKSLDISTFRTPKLVNCERMFYYSGGITNILANENFVTRYVTSGSGVFTGCTKLIGENGSTVADVGDGFSRAHVDYEGYPGLFTYKDPVITEKPTVLYHRLHAFTTEGVSFDLTGMDIGSSGTITLTVRTADDPSSVAAVFNPPTFCDFVLTDLDPGTSYLLDAEFVNSVGRTRLDRIAFKTKRVSPEGCTPKVVFDDDNLTMTFYFDALAHDEFGAGNVFEVSTTGRTWQAYAKLGQITNAIFDASFANYYPVSCKYWFYGTPKISRIINLENLNTDDVTSFQGMFRQASALTSVDLSNFNTCSATSMDEMFRNSQLIEIDLSGFDVTQVTTFNSMFTSSSTKKIDLFGWDTSFKKPDGRLMFKDCGNLTTVYAGEKTVLGRGDDMFKGAGKLVGGKGTLFDEAHVGLEYARIDDPEHGAPGYFTYKAPPADKNGLVILFR